MRGKRTKRVAARKKQNREEAGGNNGKEGSVGI